jgi:hypothetical protein
MQPTRLMEHVLFPVEEPLTLAPLPTLRAPQAPAPARPTTIVTMKSTVGYFLYKNKNKKQQQTNKQTNKNKY